MNTSSDKPASPVSMRRYTFFLRVMGVLYACLALFFLFFPNEFIYIINAGPKFLKWTEPLPELIDKFWLVLSISMLSMLSALSFLAAESPKIKGYSLVHLLSKTVSTACYFYFFFGEHHHYFGYLVGIITDALIALLLVWFLLRNFRSLKI
ncbi:MAG: hypothetical protein HY843_00560 [Bdellovibrio sp.]|nr:hypothetical protein [Bdellovibrio sp.]